jgi:uncharacterized membrane-anchored protein
MMLGGMSMTRNTTWWILALFLLVIAPATAQTKDAAPNVHPQKGPATIKLNSDATLKLPAGFLFLDKGDTAAMMRYMGNPSKDTEIGLIAEKDRNWFIVVSYTTPGHISDKDAAQLDADGLFKSFQEGNELANEERKKMGASPLELLGWAEKPRYDGATHELIWALNGRSSDGAVVNYFTRVLGREGLLSLNLVCSPEDLQASRNDIKPVLAGVTFNPGQAYADFKPGRDKDSGMSLTELILGGGAVAAAAKMGILAKLGKMIILVILALKKFVIVVIAAIAGGLNKLFKRGKSSPEGTMPIESGEPKE